MRSGLKSFAKFPGASGRAIVIGSLLTFSMSQTWAEGAEREIKIDGETWTISRDEPLCEGRAAPAIERYRQKPLYRIELTAEFDRYYVNQSDDCWVELYIAGVDDAGVAFKVSPTGDVIDEKTTSSWGPSVYPYPSGPYPVYLD